MKDTSRPQVRIYEVPTDANENDYVEELLLEDEQVQPPIDKREDEPMLRKLVPLIMLKRRSPLLGCEGNVGQRFSIGMCGSNENLLMALMSGVELRYKAVNLLFL